MRAKIFAQPQGPQKLKKKAWTGAEHKSESGLLLGGAEKIWAPSQPQLLFFSLVCHCLFVSLGFKASFSWWRLGAESHDCVVGFLL